MTNHLLIIPRSLHQAKEENVMHLTGWGGEKSPWKAQGKQRKNQEQGKRLDNGSVWISDLAGNFA